MKKQYPIDTPANNNEEKYYFIKAIRKNSETGIFAYYSGESNHIPTILIKDIKFKGNKDFDIENTTEKFPCIQLSGYSFNNCQGFSWLVFFLFTRL